MKKILLADDDSFFRTMFASMVDWTQYGLGLLHAENGRDAISMLHKHEDIVLIFTDMSMPIVDGVELIRYVSEHFPGIHCVALSAYNDFHYVKPSLKNGAEDYLLKHTLTKAQVEELLNRYIDGMDTLKNQNRDNDELKDRFLMDYITGQYSQEMALEGLFDSLSLPHLTENLLLMVLLDADEDKPPSFRGAQTAVLSQRRTARLMLQGLLDRVGVGVVFFDPEGRIFLLLTMEGFDNLHFVKQTSEVLSNQIQRMMLQYFNMKVRLDCAPLCRQGSRIHAAYGSLFHASGGKLSAEEEKRGQVRAPDSVQLLEELCFGSAESLAHLLSSAYLAGRQRHLCRERFHQLTEECMENLNQALQRLQLPAQENSIPSGSDGEQESAVLELALGLQAQAKKEAAGYFSPVVYRALRLIHTSFRDCSLSPTSIADQLHTNISYLSRLFKAQVGQNISGYISDKRLRCACYLLGNSFDSVKDVATLCGFDNYNYFFKVFKKNIGVTPKEYRTQLSDGVQETVP